MGRFRLRHRIHQENFRQIKLSCPPAHMEHEHQHVQGRGGHREGPRHVQHAGEPPGLHCQRL